MIDGWVAIWRMTVAAATVCDALMLFHHDTTRIVLSTVTLVVN